MSVIYFSRAIEKKKKGGTMDSYPRIQLLVRKILYTFIVCKLKKPQVCLR